MAFRIRLHAPKRSKNKQKTRTEEKDSTKIRKTAFGVEFGQEEYYEMILQWNLDLLPNHPFEFQRLGFKSNRSLEVAAQHAEEIARLLNKASYNTLNKKQIVKLIAVYRKNAFKDWSGEPYLKLGKIDNNFIKDRLKSIKEQKTKKPKPISYLKSQDMKVR